MEKDLKLVPWYQIDMTQTYIEITMNELSSIIEDLSHGTIFRINESGYHSKYPYSFKEESR